MKALRDLTDDLDLVRDVLDKQVVDRDGTKMGRVDGRVLELREGRPPRVATLEMGGAVLARRIHPRVARWTEWWGRRFGVRKTAVCRVPWAAVQEVTAHHIKVDVAALETAAFDWELWLRDHVFAHIPAAAKGGRE
jgi:sporulation protein YlmC with PRC-barrel domain